jgi:transketolase
MGKGVDFMENDHNWHGKPPTKNNLKKPSSSYPKPLETFRLYATLNMKTSALGIRAPALELRSWSWAKKMNV